MVYIRILTLNQTLKDDEELSSSLSLISFSHSNNEDKQGVLSLSSSTSNEETQGVVEEENEEEV